MHLPDPFKLLGIPRKFDLDEAALRHAYLAKVSNIHPDLVGEDDAQAASAELNQAREVLSNPEFRADALLRLRGGPAKDADKSLPPGFLMEIMETREAVESALASGSPVERAKWTDWGYQQRAAYIQVVGALFKAADEGSPSVQSLKEIRTTLNAWRYIERLIEQLDPAHDHAREDFKN